MVLLAFCCYHKLYNFTTFYPLLDNKRQKKGTSIYSADIQTFLVHPRNKKDIKTIAWIGE